MPDRCHVRVWILLLLLPVSATTEELVQEVAVTSRGRDHGEVQLLRRDEAVIVQTRLDSKILRQVVKRIRDMEQENWPADADQYPASQRYLQGLDEALAAAYKTPPAEDRRRRLVIEFGLSPSLAWVTFPPGLPIELPRDYVRRNMVLIAADRGLNGVPELLAGL